MNNKQQQTLKALYEIPIRSNMRWNDVESLLKNLGAKMQEGSGSRLRVQLNGVVAVFHRPHPIKVLDKGALVTLRRFLKNAGVPNVKI